MSTSTKNLNLIDIYFEYFLSEIEYIIHSGLVKKYRHQTKNIKRINLTKVSLMKNIIDKPISKVEFTLVNRTQVEELSKHISSNGSTEVKIKFKENGNFYVFNLGNKRNIERKTLKLLKNSDISALIN